MNGESDFLKAYKLNFKEESVCLKCGYRSLVKETNCPKCGGPVCPVIFKTK